MFVGPRGVTARAMHDAKDCVGADEVPRIDRSASGFGIANQSRRVDGGNTAIGQTGSGCAAIQLALVEIDALFVFGARAGGRGAWSARPSGDAVACGLGRRIQ